MATKAYFPLREEWENTGPIKGGVRDWVSDEIEDWLKTHNLHWEVFYNMKSTNAYTWWELELEGDPEDIMLFKLTWV